MLWQRSLVIRDMETGSLWSHLLGQCMQGPLKDRTFDFIPATLTTWRDWKKEHPETTVLHLSRTASRFRRDLLGEKAPVGYGIKIGQTTAVYSYTHLARHPVYEDRVSDQPVVIVFEPESIRTFAYLRLIDDSEHHFEDGLNKGFLVDKETKTQWDPWTGRAADGPLKGRTLQPVHGLITYINAWEHFYPDGKVIK